MKGKFDDHIRENRHNFDDAEPSEKVWGGISNAMKFEGKTNKFLWIWKAAAILFFISSVLLYIKPSFGEESVSDQKEEIASDFSDVEDYYFQLISDKRQLIVDLKDQDILEEAFEQDLQRLDVMYEVLKDELKQNPSKKVVDALILNLLVRIDILNGQLAVLDTEEPKDEDNSQVDI